MGKGGADLKSAITVLPIDIASVLRARPLAPRGTTPAFVPSSRAAPAPPRSIPPNTQRSRRGHCTLTAPRPPALPCPAAVLPWGWRGNLCAGDRRGGANAAGGAGPRRQSVPDQPHLRRLQQQGQRGQLVERADDRDRVLGMPLVRREHAGLHPLGIPDHRCASSIPPPHLRWLFLSRLLSRLSPRALNLPLTRSACTQVRC